MSNRVHVIALMYLLGVGGAMAQSHQVFGAGATESSIPAGRIRATLGQPVIGPVALRNAGRTLQGFWYNLDEEGTFPTSTPLNGEYVSLAPFPNPATTHSELRGVIPPTRSLHIELVNALGTPCEILFDGPHPGGAFASPLPVESLASGSYLITIRTSQSQRAIAFGKE